ncbi:MAG: zf-HC2 domain-containing protein [Candidatus Omnitrophica bacterium]|nr:zf-HC2 domain-containing protein [Candidatus Omnitrophota bacterium]
MDCKKVRDLLFTDYVDGELAAIVRSEVEAHISRCAACRELEKRVHSGAIEPFRASVREEPPAYIFERIRERVTAGRPVRQSIAELIASLCHNPGPIAAFAAAVAVIIALVVAVPVAGKNPLNEYLDEQMGYITNLDAEEVNGYGIFNTDIGTGAELLL